MDPVALIALSALGVSAMTFIATQFGNKRTATASYVQELERRVERLEEEVGYKNARIVELEAENLRLMKRILAT